jgi:CMP-N-acetylneuraminic acid synthetase
MSLLAIIPAKSNSRRLKNKTYLKINGEMLWERAERTAIESKIFDQIVVVTDWRHPYLLDDEVHSAAVCFEVLSKLRYAHDHFCLLNPCSPRRTPSMLRDAWQHFVKIRKPCLYSVDQMDKHNGDFLFWKTLPFLRFISRSCLPGYGVKLMTQGVDINTQEDFDLAKSLLSRE